MVICVVRAGGGLTGPPPDLVVDDGVVPFGILGVDVGTGVDVPESRPPFRWKPPTELKPKAINKTAGAMRNPNRCRNRNFILLPYVFGVAIGIGPTSFTQRNPVAE